MPEEVLHVSWAAVIIGMLLSILLLVCGNGVCDYDDPNMNRVK